MEAEIGDHHPSGAMKLPGAGFDEITGLAWSGRGRVERWKCRPMAARAGSSHRSGSDRAGLPTRFRYPWWWDGKPAVLQTRAWTRPATCSRRSSSWSRFAGLGGKFGAIYHLNAIQSWQVASDGSVTNVHA